jgi:hypothetical protein
VRMSEARSCVTSTWLRGSVRREVIQPMMPLCSAISLGGIRMVIRMAELARAGLTPDWMPGVVPRCVPVETRQNQHGVRAVTQVVGTERVLSRGRWRTVDILACPVTWRPHPEQIASARRGYDDWRQALDWVRDGLLAGRMLREVEVTAAMPKVRPWLARKHSAV